MRRGNNKSIEQYIEIRIANSKEDMKKAQTSMTNNGITEL